MLSGERRTSRRLGKSLETWSREGISLSDTLRHVDPNALSSVTEDAGVSTIRKVFGPDHRKDTYVASMHIPRYRKVGGRDGIPNCIPKLLLLHLQWAVRSNF